MQSRGYYVRRYIEENGRADRRGDGSNEKGYSGKSWYVDGADIPVITQVTMQHYGKKLKGLIRWKGVTFVDTAKGAVVPLSTLNNEFTKAAPDLSVCLKVLAYIGIGVDALFSERDLSPVEADLLEAVRRLSDAKKKALLEFSKER